MPDDTNPPVATGEETAAADESAPQTPAADPEKATAVAKVAQLQAEYEQVAAACANAARRLQPYGELLARKGDLTRKIDKIKRAYDLP